MGKKITDFDQIASLNDADLIEVVDDVVGTPTSKKSTWTIIKAFLKTYFDTLYFTKLNLNLRIVQSSQTIQSVIDGITDASANKPYVVIIPPGIYTERITGKDYVSIKGSGKYSTVIQYENTGVNYGTIILANNIAVTNLTVKATGSNGMCFATPTRAVVFVVDNVYTESTADSFWASQAVNGDHAITGYFYDCTNKINYDAFAVVGAYTETVNLHLFNNIIEIADSPSGNSVRGIANNSANSYINMYGGIIKGSFSANKDVYGVYSSGATSLTKLMNVIIDLNNLYATSYDLIGVRATYGDIEIYGGSISVSGNVTGDMKDVSTKDSFGIGSINIYGTKYSFEQGDEIGGTSKGQGKNLTLSANGTFAPEDGNTFIIDPGGAARDFNPTGQFSVWTTITVINIADAAETLTFEPTFTAAGSHDGSSQVAILSDLGESWVTDQLVGKTITNTTDSSSGLITANTGTTVTATLTGGTWNWWNTGDSYTIAPAGLNQAIAQNERGIFVYDGSSWLKVFVG